jgi:hypothetical protein
MIGSTVFQFQKAEHPQESAEPQEAEPTIQAPVESLMSESETL